MLTHTMTVHAAMSTRNQFHSTFGEEPCELVSDYTSKRKWSKDGFDQTDPGPVMERLQKAKEGKNRR